MFYVIYILIRYADVWIKKSDFFHARRFIQGGENFVWLYLQVWRKLALQIK